MNKETIEKAFMLLLTKNNFGSENNLNQTKRTLIPPEPGMYRNPPVKTHNMTINDILRRKL